MISLCRDHSEIKGMIAYLVFDVTEIIGRNIYIRIMTFSNNATYLMVVVR